MQVLIIAGNVGKDAVLRRTQDGEPVLGFSLAVDNGKDRDGNPRQSTWYDCAVWGKRGEALQHHIVKGLRLTLSGRPTAREHDGKAYLGIAVDELTFMGGGNSDRDERSDRSGGDYGARSSGGEASQQSQPQRQPAQAPQFSRDMDDDIPFMAEWRV